MIHEHPAGLTWVVADEPMERASHALVADDGVWLVDPVADDEALARVEALDQPVRGVIQLLDRHPRDNRALAERFDVAHYLLPVALPSSPFELVEVLNLPVWRESALWWPARKTLVVAEILGTPAYFRLGPGAVGVHPMVRLLTPGALRSFEPETLLFGHGAPVTGPGTAQALAAAYAGARSDLRYAPLRLPALLRAGRSFKL